MQQLQKQQSYQKQGQSYPNQIQFKLSQQQNSQYPSTNNIKSQFSQNLQYNQSVSPNMMLNPSFPISLSQQNQQQHQYKSSHNQFYRFAPHPNSFVSQNQKDQNGSSQKQNKISQNKSENISNMENYLNNCQNNYNAYNNSGNGNIYDEESNYSQSSSEFLNNQYESNEPQFKYQNYSNNQQFQQYYGKQSQPQQNYLNSQTNNQMKSQSSLQQNLLQQQQYFGQKQQLQEQMNQPCLNYSSSSSSTSSCYQNQQQQQQNQQSRYKTHKCRHFISGNCTLGDRCNFAHNDKEMRDPQDPLPFNVQVGQKVQITNYKTIKCRYYDNGFCKNSEKCSFAHGNIELLTPGVTLNNINAFPQQNQLQMSEQQQEQMRKESIEQQNNSEYLKNNIYDVISELKQSFPNNSITQNQLEEAQECLNKGQLIQAHKVIQDIFNNPNRTTQEKQHMLSIVKRLNEYYKSIMVTKYKSEQSGFSQSSFFQQISFDGFSQEFQNTYMNDVITNSHNNNCNQGNKLSDSQHGNPKNQSSTTNQNFNVNSNITQLSNLCLNKSNCQDHINSHGGSKNEYHIQNNLYKKDNSPIQNQTSNIWFQNSNLYSNQNTVNVESNSNQKCFTFEELHDKHDYQLISELNQNFKNLNLGNESLNPNKEGQLNHIDNEMSQRKNQIQDIFSSDNSNLIVFKNEQKYEFHKVLEDEFTDQKNQSNDTGGDKGKKNNPMPCDQNQDNSKNCAQDKQYELQTSKNYLNQEISTDDELKKQQY